MTSSINNSSYCLTNTIDKYSNISNQYYHNINSTDNTVLMRPRLPLRYDFNDVEIVKVQPEDREIRSLLRHYGRLGYMIDTSNLYQLKRTTYSIINTFLLYLLAFILITASFINMKKTSSIIQEDYSLNKKDKLMFRIGFILSFIVLLLLICYVFLSMFEIYRNMDKFSYFTANNFRYKNMNFLDGNFYNVRFIVLFFVIICILVSIAEVFNLFFMKQHNPSILFILFPIFLCIFLLVRMYVFYNNNNV